MGTVVGIALFYVSDTHHLSKHPARSKVGEVNSMKNSENTALKDVLIVVLLIFVPCALVTAALYTAQHPITSALALSYLSMGAVITSRSFK